VVDLLAAFRGSFDPRLAAIVGPSLFLLGTADGHLLNLYQTGNLAPAMPTRFSIPTSCCRSWAPCCFGSDTDEMNPAERKTPPAWVTNGPCRGCF